MSTLDDGWKPSKEIPVYGHFDGATGQVHLNQRPANSLVDSTNPIIRRLGFWCENAPYGLESNMAAFGGLLMGMTVGSNHPEVARRLLDQILGERDDGHLADMLEAFDAEIFSSNDIEMDLD